MVYASSVAYECSFVLSFNILCIKLNFYMKTKSAYKSILISCKQHLINNTSRRSSCISLFIILYDYSCITINSFFTRSGFRAVIDHSSIFNEDSAVSTSALMPSISSPIGLINCIFFFIFFFCKSQTNI